MCAELLTIKWSDKGEIWSEEAALEDISPTGASLRLREPIPVETKIALHYPKGKYLGKVRHCTFQETGYVIGIAFDNGYRWSKSDFQPSYLFEVPVVVHPAKSKRG
jgi:hypothetical protein